MPKGARYELLVYADRSIEGSYDYMIESTKPLPHLAIGMVFKSYQLEKKRKPEQGCEFRIRDIQLVHYSHESGPNVWQTKIRLASFRQALRNVMKDGDNIPMQHFEEVEEGVAKEAKSAELSRSQWDLTTKYLEI
jgi:hypothetical protein